MQRGSAQRANASTTDAIPMPDRWLQLTAAPGREGYCCITLGAWRRESPFPAPWLAAIRGTCAAAEVQALQVASCPWLPDDQLLASQRSFLVSDARLVFPEADAWRVLLVCLPLVAHSSACTGCTCPGQAAAPVSTYPPALPSPKYHYVYGGNRGNKEVRATLEAVVVTVRHVLGPEHHQVEDSVTVCVVGKIRATSCAVLISAGGAVPADTCTRNLVHQCVECEGFNRSLRTLVARAAAAARARAADAARSARRGGGRRRQGQGGRGEQRQGAQRDGGTRPDEIERPEGPPTTDRPATPRGIACRGEAEDSPPM